MLKDTEPDELALAIRAIYKGHTQLVPGLFEKALMSVSVTAPPLNIPQNWRNLHPEN
ncbi:MAG: hypothetical protein ACRDEA_19325 [Microcystaceae cyanobacterium]